MLTLAGRCIVPGVRVFIFLLVCYGFTNIVTGSKIFAPLRAWVLARSEMAGYWIQCMMCFGFAAGVLWAAVGLWPRVTWLPVDMLAAGCASSGACWVVHVVMHKMGEDEL